MYQTYRITRWPWVLAEVVLTKLLTPESASAEAALRQLCLLSCALGQKVPRWFFISVGQNVNILKPSQPD